MRGSKASTASDNVVPSHVLAPALPIAGVLSFSWVSITGPAVFFPEWHIRENGTEIDVLSYIPGDGKVPPTVKIRGFTFPMKTLARERRPGRTKGDSKPTPAIYLDLPPDDQNLDQSICLCFGIIRVVDNITVTAFDGPLSMFGLLLIQEETEIPRGSANSFYRRVGFYDGLLPDVDLNEMDKVTVDII